MWKIGALPFALMLASALGCVQTMHHYQPVDVLVKDAETDRPIPNASVRFSSETRDLFAAKETAGTTRGDGQVEVMGDADNIGPLILSGTAAGYLDERLTISREKLLRADPTRHQPGVVLELFANPRPSIELIVPDAFHGLLIAKYMPLDCEQCVPSQRSFTFFVPKHGLVLMNGRRVLLQARPADYRAHFVNGMPLLPNPAPDEFGLRWLARRDKDQLFVVGTQKEFDQIARKFRKPLSLSDDALDVTAVNAWISKRLSLSQ